MSSFTTRVELHDATWSDYERLHAEMKRQGFGQTIRSDAGTVYELPPAEYNLEADLKRSDVLERAKAAGTAVRKKFSVIVTESAGRTWHNLPLS